MPDPRAFIESIIDLQRRLGYPADVPQERVDAAVDALAKAFPATSKGGTPR